MQDFVEPQGLSHNVPLTTHLIILADKDVSKEMKDPAARSGISGFEITVFLSPQAAGNSTPIRLKDVNCQSRLSYRKKVCHEIR
jgi:hypothetical protein